MDERIKKQYFIDPLGKVHKYKGNVQEVISYHYLIGKQIFPEQIFPDDKLMELGWIMAGSSCYHRPIIHRKPTQAQLNKLDELGILEYLEILEYLAVIHNGKCYNYNEISCYL